MANDVKYTVTPGPDLYPDEKRSPRWCLLTITRNGSLVDQLRLSPDEVRALMKALRPFRGDAESR
jgi:hypothetical protein